jgi:hypothetical protein
MKIEIDQEIVETKVKEIGKLVNGMRIPELLAVFGNLIVDMVTCVDKDGVGFDKITRGWLLNLADQVVHLKDDTEEEGQVVN